MKNYVHYAPNIGAAKDWISSWTKPITDFALWLIPIVALISLLVAFIRWYTLDEREKEQKPFMKILKNHLFALIIAESITTILKILGLEKMGNHCF